MIIILQRVAAAALGLWLVCCAHTAGAVTQIPQPLTLDAALAWAGQYNPALREAELNLQRLGGQVTRADVAVPSNPRLELEAGQRSERGRGDSADIGIRLSQELWIAGQSGLRESAARNDLAGARRDYEYLASTITARTRSAFLAVLVAEEAVATAQRVVSINEALDTFARKRLDAGAGTRLETNTALLGLQRARAFAAAATDRAVQARLRLKDLLAIDPSRRLAIRGSIDFAALTLPDESTLVAKAVARRQDLDAAARRVLAAGDRLALARRLIVPNITVAAFYREEGGGRNSGGADIVGGGIGFELPILNRYAGERESAVAQLSAAELDQDTRQREVRLQVLSAASAYRSARDQSELLNDAVLNAAESTLELTRRSFSAGKVGAPAISTAQTQLIDVRRDYIDALTRLVAAGTELERATGGLLAMQTATSAP